MTAFSIKPIDYIYLAKNNPMKIITLFLATALCIATTYAQNSINLQKGQKYQVETKSTIASNTEMQGQSMETNMVMTSISQMEVSDVTATNIHLNNTITKILMNMSMMGQDMNFDSDKKEDMDGPMGSQFKDYINKPFAVNMEKSGKIIVNKKEGDKTNMNPMMAQSFGDVEAQGYGAQGAFQSLPADLKVGSTWTVNTSTSNAKNVTNYTVKSIAGDLATLALTGTVTVEMEMEQQGMEITTKTKGKITGSEIVNIKTGVIQTNTTTIDSEGSLEMMGQEIPTTSKATTTTTVKAI